MTQHIRQIGMLKSQRRLVFISLLAAAWMLNVLLCDWHYKYIIPRSGQYRIVTYAHREDQSRRAVPSTGLFTQPGVAGGTATVLGVVLPLGLLAADAYLLLGWRHAARLRKGCCPQCGYDLRGLPPDRKCPECGWNREKAEA